MTRPHKSPDSPRSWGNELYMRERIAARRKATAALRAAGVKWATIARALGHRDANHARIDWLRFNEKEQA